MRLGVVQWHLMKLEEAISSFNTAEALLSLTHGMNHPTGKVATYSNALVLLYE